MNMFMINYSEDENRSQRLLDNRAFIAQSIVFALLLINAFRADTVPGILILGLSMIIPFFLRPMEIAAYIVGFSMMGTGVQVAYIGLSCVVSLLFRSKMQIQKVTLMSILVYALYEIMNFSIVSDDVTEFIRYAVVYALLFFILFMDYEAADKIRVVDSYIYGTLFCFLHVFVEAFSFFDGDLSRFVDGSFRFGYSQQLGIDLTMSADPNAIGQGCSIIIVVCLMLILLEYRHWKYYAAIFVALLVGTLTISKTFLISLVLIVILITLSSGSLNLTKIWSRLLLLSVLFFVGYLVVMKLNPSYIENILSRVDESDITTGRVSNAQVYLDYLSQDIPGMLFGVGLQNVGDKIGFSGSPHAMIIESLICWGLTGTLAVFFMIAYATWCHVRDRRMRILNYVPLLIFLVIMQTTQLFRLRDRIFTLVVVIVAAGISPKGDKENECQ